MCTVKKVVVFPVPFRDVTNQTLPSQETGKTIAFFTVHGDFIITLQDLDILVTLIRTFATLVCV
jgi:hypothetical protein